MALEALDGNEHIKAMTFHNERYRHWMREIQGEYEVNQDYLHPRGFQIRLTWDHDRLWVLSNCTLSREFPSRLWSRERPLRSC